MRFPPKPSFSPEGSSFSSPLLGIGLVLLSGVFISAMNMMAKHLSTLYPIILLIWLRFLVHFAVNLGYALTRYTIASLYDSVPHPFLQLLRGLALMSGSGLYYVALLWLPLGDVVALIFLAPPTVTLLAPFFLGERVGRARRIAVAIGFIGALFVVRPGFRELNVGLLAGVGSGLSFGFYLLLTRFLSPITPTSLTLLYSSIPGTALLAPFGLWAFWMMPSSSLGLSLALAPAVGIAAMLAHFFITAGYRFAPASVLAPFSYMELPLTVFGAYLIFGEVPQPWSWLGMAVLTATGIYISWREGTRRRDG